MVRELSLWLEGLVPRVNRSQRNQGTKLIIATRNCGKTQPESHTRPEHPQLVPERWWRTKSPTKNRTTLFVGNSDAFHMTEHTVWDSEQHGRTITADVRKGLSRVNLWKAIVSDNAGRVLKEWADSPTSSTFLLATLLFLHAFTWPPLCQCQSHQGHASATFIPWQTHWPIMKWFKKHMRHILSLLPFTTDTLQFTYHS